MNQRWWIALVAVVGVGLAIFLIPRPDTGGELSTTIPTNQDPLNFNAGDAPPTPPATAGASAPNRADRKPIAPGRVMTGPKPGMEDRIAKRGLPEAVYAGKLLTPFSAIRYTLMKLPDDAQAKALVDELGLVQIEINTVRQNPDTSDWAAFQVKADAVMTKISGSQFASDTQIVQSLERYKQTIAEYHEAKANGGVEPAKDPGTASPAGTPPKEATK